MNWKPEFTEHLADILRLIAKGALLMNCIILALSSTYLTARLCYRFVQYLDRVLFNHSW